MLAYEITIIVKYQINYLKKFLFVSVFKIFYYHILTENSNYSHIQIFTFRTLL